MSRDGHLRMGDGAEFDAIRRLLAVWGSRAEGIGDDAAVLALPAGESLIASTDACVEGVHFRAEWLAPEEIGARAAAAALSDLAAMGATPVGLLLALAVPDRRRHEIDALARGVGAVAAGAGCPIVGGNLTAALELSLTTTVLGATTHPLRRSGASEGDIIFVTGRLGGPGAALRAFERGETPTADHRARFAAPVPRIAEARWLAQRGATAAIDISDGLVADAGHLARASGLTAAIESRVVPYMPGVTTREALASGEEYELLVTFARERTVDAAEFEATFGIPLTRIGEMVRAGSRPVLVSGGEADAGWDHFA